MFGRLFDPEASVMIRYHNRPHWCQEGTLAYITFRTADSIPAEVIRRWDVEKQDWLVANKLPADRHWTAIVPGLSLDDQNRFREHFSRLRDMCLDECLGACVLRERSLAQIVVDTLMYFDGTRYAMGDFVVMPNHVHLLASFFDERSIVDQCDSWLHYSARQINLRLGRKGKFWQQEPFDHLVRSANQYDYLRNYIAQNGPKAGLAPTEYYHHRRD